MFPAVCPVADRYEWLPQRNVGGPMTYTRGLVLHVNAGNGDPFGWWTQPSTPIASSHFQLMKSGELIQYVPLDVVAWCQVAGSSTWHSIETEGFPEEALTDAAVAKLAKLYAWGAQACGWKMQLADSPDGEGFGWHGMGGYAWGGHFGCPGDARKAQRAQILKLAKQGGADPLMKDLTKMVVVDPGASDLTSKTHPKMVELVRSLMLKINPTIDVSSPAQWTRRLREYQAIFFNEWHMPPGGPHPEEVDGKCGPHTLAALVWYAGGGK